MIFGVATMLCRTPLFGFKKEWVDFDGAWGATWLRDADVDELVIALLLGHRSTFDPVAGLFQAPSHNVTRSYTRIFEAKVRQAVAVFDAIRMEIDPPTEREEIDERYESGIESVELPQGLNYWSGEGYLVAHTGFEPVLPP